MDFVIVEVPVLSGVEDPNRWGVLADQALWRAESIAIYGNDDLASTEKESVAYAVPYASRRMRLWAAVAEEGVTDPGQVLGTATLRLSLHDNLHAGDSSIIVAPAARRQGIGGALIEAVHGAARAEGRTVVQGWSGGPDAVAADAPGALAAASGTGWVDGMHPTARFCTRHGYVLEQLEAHAVLDVSTGLERAGALLAEAEAASSGYRAVTWIGPCTEEHLDALAGLHQAMSTDAPVADLELEEERWDAERIRAVEARTLAGGVTSLTTVALHEATGQLAGYTTIEHNAAQAASAIQSDTLVLRAHRGHRLGQLLKAVNLRALARYLPDVRRIHTWNAEENDHMLAINGALGFRPVSTESGWQVRLGG